MDGFKTIEELEEEEKLARNTFDVDVSGLQSGLTSAFQGTKRYNEINNDPTMRELDPYYSTLRDGAYEKSDLTVCDTAATAQKNYVILDENIHKQFMQHVSNSKTVFNRFLDEIGATKDEKTFMNALYGKSADRIAKGYPDGYLSYKTPLGDSVKSCLATLNTALPNHKLQQNIDKYRQKFPIFGFVQHANKQFDILIDFWEEKKSAEPMSPEKEQEYREKLYEEIVAGTVLFDKMMSAVEDPEIAKEIDNDKVLGNDPFHIHPLSVRGMRQTSSSLESYKKCLENGWAIDDIAFVANFKYLIDDLEAAANGNRAIKYADYKKENPPVYHSEESKQHIQKMKTLYEEIAANPLRSAEQRKDWLDKMDALVKEGMQKDYLKYPNGKQSDILPYYNQVAKQRPLRDKRIEDKKEIVVHPAVDSEKVLANRKATEERLFMRRFNAMESQMNTKRTDWWFGSENEEHRNLREAVENLKNFYRANKGKERTPEEQEDYARKLLNRLDAVEHLAKVYIEKKKSAGTTAGSERIRGAVNFKDFAREQKQELLKEMTGMHLEGSYSTVDAMRTRLILNKTTKNMQKLEEMGQIPADGRQRTEVIIAATDIIIGRIAAGNGIKGKDMLAEFGALGMRKEFIRNKNFVKIMDNMLKEPGLTGKKLVEKLGGDDILRRIGGIKNDVEKKNTELQQKEENKEMVQPKKVVTPPIMGK